MGEAQGVRSGRWAGVRSPRALGVMARSWDLILGVMEALKTEPIGSCTIWMFSRQHFGHSEKSGWGWDWEEWKQRAQGRWEFGRGLHTACSHDSTVSTVGPCTPGRCSWKPAGPGATVPGSPGLDRERHPNVHTTLPRGVSLLGDV